MANAILNAAAGPLAGYLSLAADPRSGTGQVAVPGQWAMVGTVAYQCVGTGANDWVKVPFYARTVVGAAPVTAVTFSGLNGDADKVYHWEANIVSVTNNSACSIKPNNASTNQFNTRYYNNGGGGAGWGGDAYLFIGTQKKASGVSVMRCRGTLVAKTGFMRPFHNVAYEIDAGAVVYAEVSDGIWYDTSTNVTSLVFTAADADSIGAASTFTLWSPAEGYYL
jgi:hypothetical protein